MSIHKIEFLGTFKVEQLSHESSPAKHITVQKIVAYINKYVSEISPVSTSYFWSDVSYPVPKSYPPFVDDLCILTNDNKCLNTWEVLLNK